MPIRQRQKTLELVHTAHVGVANTYNAARSHYFWEYMHADAENLISLCGVCIEFQNARPFELEIGKDKPTSSPMEWVGFGHVSSLKGHPIFL